MSEEEIIKGINILIMQLVHERKENRASIEQIKFQEIIQGLLDLYQVEKEKTEELRNKNAELNKEKEKNKAYDKLLERYNKLVCCHLQYEEMTGIDLLLPDKVDVISKGKIKAKIEEKEKRYEEISKEKFLNKNETQKVLNAQIAGYKELLQEE